MIVIDNKVVSLNEVACVVEKTFDINPVSLRKKQKPYRVKVNGNYVVTDSKKTIWPSIGAAKNAIRNHINNSHELSRWINQIVKPGGIGVGFSWNSTSKNIKKEITATLEERNIIEYVPYIEGE